MPEFRERRSNNLKTKMKKLERRWLGGGSSSYSQVRVTTGFDWNIGRILCVDLLESGSRFWGNHFAVHTLFALFGYLATATLLWPEFLQALPLHPRACPVILAPTALWLVNGITCPELVCWFASLHAHVNMVQRRVKLRETQSPEVESLLDDAVFVLITDPSQHLHVSLQVGVANVTISLALGSYGGSRGVKKIRKLVT